jgi:Arginine decarboxylase (spermidine biosynthesis)
VFNVLDVSGLGDEQVPTTTTPDMEQPLVDLIETHDGLTSRNALEGYHDAQQALDMAMNLFAGGYLSLEAAVAGREPVLGDLPEAAEAGAGDGRSAGGSAEPRRIAVGHLLLQLLHVPVDA